jgi:cytochrome c oxidase subunit 3
MSAAAQATPDAAAAAPHAAPHAAAHEHRDDEATKLGMWLFLFTELLLFGGLFLLFASYRATYAVDFHHGSGELNSTIGVFNTFVLLTSSLTVALSIAALQRGNTKATLGMLGATLALGALFLFDKYLEWHAEIVHHGIYPSSAALLARPKGEILFYGLYFTMTGLHALHIIAGMTVLAIVGVLVAKGRVTADRFGALENAGLYWHLVDIIWIFLLPLFYLVG